MEAELGKIYKTRGGWDAKVIWISSTNLACYVIHQPGTLQESVPISHNKMTGESVAALSVAPPPIYGRQQPADLILE
jgi:hypothetical protein